MKHPQRGTIFLEDARIASHEAHPGGQRVLRLYAPRQAAAAEPGSFVHLRCADALPMRRPMSVMLADTAAGTIDILYKVAGAGTRLLAAREPGETLSVLGPVGRPFRPVPGRPRALLLGGGVGIPPMVFLAERLRRHGDVRPLVLMGSELPFPFRARPSAILVSGMPAGVIGAMPLLEDWHVPSRLASNAGFAGCFEGHVTELARAWMAALDAPARAEVAIYACGPTPMLAACARLAAEFGLPCQVSLEEFMACAVGGCAGCAVRVHTRDGPAMKRVCVDGPVFEAADVVWEAVP